MSDIDFRELLRKYMARVIAAESVSYVDTYVGMGEYEPTDAEMAELQKIESELRLAGIN